MEEVEEAAKEGMIAMEIEGDTEEVVTTVVAEAETDMMIVEAAGGTLALALVLALVPVQETDTEDTIANHAALEASDQTFVMPGRREETANLVMIVVSITLRVTGR